MTQPERRPGSIPGVPRPSPLSVVRLDRTRLGVTRPRRSLLNDGAQTVTFIAACPACGHDARWFEERDDGTETPVITCPHCD